MSTLDRAFLKAYGKSNSADPRPDRPHMGLKPRVAARSPAAEKASTSPAAERAVQLAKASQVCIHVEPAAPAVPAPHLTHAAGAARPATSELHTVASGPAPSTDNRQPLRPVFEVQKVAWPAICQSLLREAEADLAAVADDLAAGARQGENRVLVTSRQRGEGRTTVLLCLARLLSARGLTVVLVDADFTQPTLARRLRLLPQTGWESLLEGEQPLEEALIEAVEDHVTLLPLRGPLDAKQVASHQDGIGQTLAQLSAAWDVVLVDGGPLDDARPAWGLIEAAAFDAAVLVRDARRSTPDDGTETARRLAATGIRRWELAENFVTAS